MNPLHRNLIINTLKESGVSEVSITSIEQVQRNDNSTVYNVKIQGGYDRLFTCSNCMEIMG